jgi:hypothetical protein
MHPYGRYGNFSRWEDSLLSGSVGVGAGFELGITLHNGCWSGVEYQLGIALHNSLGCISEWSSFRASPVRSIKPMARNSAQEADNQYAF